jgi:protease-4
VRGNAHASQQETFEPMSIDADYLVDRKRLQRRLSFWRVLAFVILILALLGAAIYGARDSLSSQIARVSVDGVITDDWEQREMLRKLGESDRVKAVILAINSPGGTTGGGEALYHAIRDLSDKKPVVATIGTLGASAAYMSALAADRIYVRETSITGSIGVIFQWANVEELAETLGIEVKSITSDPLKAQPSPFAPETAEAREVIEAMITDTHRWFVDIFAERRDLTPAQARTLADGRIYSGKRALELELVDEIGGEKEAREWLISERGVPADAKIRKWSPGSVTDAGMLLRAGHWLLSALGLESLRDLAEKLTPLDGLISVWQPQSTEE